jgi:hypothetical protein
MGKETKLGKIGKFILKNKVLRCQVQLATRLVYFYTKRWQLSGGRFLQ